MPAANDPASADRAGVVLDRVLWTRAPSWKQALRCTERLLQTEGFPVVLIRGLPVDAGSMTGSDMIRDAADDLFR